MGIWNSKKILQRIKDLYSIFLSIHKTLLFVGLKLLLPTK